MTRSRFVICLERCCTMPGLPDAERDGSLQAGGERHDAGGLLTLISGTVNVQ
jgi:hypothetical protein